VTGPTYTPGTALTVRFEVAGSGPATLRAKAWTAGTQEPAAWQITAADTSAALQRPGGLQVEVYHSKSATAPVTVRVDNLKVEVPGTAG
jgi:hypothetical protein